jgi:stress response protein YsnF
VSLNKRRVQEPQKVSATVRKERPSVETTGDVDDRVDDDSL